VKLLARISLACMTASDKQLSRSKDSILVLDIGTIQRVDLICLVLVGEEIQMVYEIIWSVEESAINVCAMSHTKVCRRLDVPDLIKALEEFGTAGEERMNSV
jgi:hypothetical protein